MDIVAMHSLGGGTLCVCPIDGCEATLSLVTACKENTTIIARTPFAVLVVAELINYSLGVFVMCGLLIIRAQNHKFPCLIGFSLLTKNNGSPYVRSSAH